MIKLKTVKDSVLTFILFSVIGALCLLSASAKAGALSGIKMCEKIIIPSLLPVLIISNLIIKTACSEIIERIFGRIYEKIFRLPSSTVSAVILGLIGGYPTGTVLTRELYKKGHIDSCTAERIMHFNICGGGAFIITAVGTVTYGSTKTGLLLFLSNVLSALIIMLFERKTNCRTTKKQKEKNHPDFSLALSDSAETAVKAIAMLSAYIILFSALYGIINPPSRLAPLLEITNGICLAKNPLPLPYCAFFLSFGGLCIHLQLIGYLKEMKLKYREFLLYRMISALLSFLIMKTYLYFFPQEAEVFNNLSSRSHEFTNGSLALSLIMIIGCAVIVFDIESRKLKLI